MQPHDLGLLPILEMALQRILDRQLQIVPGIRLGINRIAKRTGSKAVSEMRLLLQPRLPVETPGTGQPLPCGQPQANFLNPPCRWFIIYRARGCIALFNAEPQSRQVALSFFFLALLRGFAL
jgi:hypothetical protein